VVSLSNHERLQIRPSFDRLRACERIAKTGVLEANPRYETRPLEPPIGDKFTNSQDERGVEIAFLIYPIMARLEDMVTLE
jgi:hypothetical protein